MIVCNFTNNNDTSFMDINITTTNELISNTFNNHSRKIYINDYHQHLSSLPIHNTDLVTIDNLCEKSDESISLINKIDVTNTNQLYENSDILNNKLQENNKSNTNYTDISPISDNNKLQENNKSNTNVTETIYKIPNNHDISLTCKDNFCHDFRNKRQNIPRLMVEKMHIWNIRANSGEFDKLNYNQYRKKMTEFGLNGKHFHVGHIIPNVHGTKRNSGWEDMGTNLMAQFAGDNIRLGAKIVSCLESTFSSRIHASCAER